MRRYVRAATLTTLEVTIPLSDPQDVIYRFNDPGPSSSLPSTSSQDPGVETDATHATYTNVGSILLVLHSLTIPLDV